MLAPRTAGTGSNWAAKWVAENSPSEVKFIGPSLWDDRNIENIVNGREVKASENSLGRVESIVKAAYYNNFQPRYKVPSKDVAFNPASNILVAVFPGTQGPQQFQTYKVNGNQLTPIERTNQFFYASVLNPFANGFATSNGYINEAGHQIPWRQITANFPGGPYHSVANRGEGGGWDYYTLISDSGRYAITINDMLQISHAGSLGTPPGANETSYGGKGYMSVMMDHSISYLLLPGNDPSVGAIRIDDKRGSTAIDRLKDGYRVFSVGTDYWDTNRTDSQVIFDFSGNVIKDLGASTCVEISDADGITVGDYLALNNGAGKGDRIIGTSAGAFRVTERGELVSVDGSVKKVDGNLISSGFYIGDGLYQAKTACTGNSWFYNVLTDVKFDAPNGVCYSKGIVTDGVNAY